MLYLYSKDNYGFEFCKRFENQKELQRYCFLHLPENNDYMIAWVAYPGENEVWEADGDYSPNTRAIAACVEAAEKDGMKRPFWVICTGDCEYEAFQQEDDIDFFELCRIWEDWGQPRTTLRRYESGEITPEEADLYGMYLLAQYLREDLGLSDESDK